MRTRRQIEQDAQPQKGAVMTSPQHLLELILEVLLDIRDQEYEYVPKE